MPNVNEEGMSYSEWINAALVDYNSALPNPAKDAAVRRIRLTLGSPLKLWKDGIDPTEIRAWLAHAPKDK